MRRNAFGWWLDVLMFAIEVTNGLKFCFFFVWRLYKKWILTFELNHFSTSSLSSIYAVHGHMPNRNQLKPIHSSDWIYVLMKWRLKQLNDKSLVILLNFIRASFHKLSWLRKREETEDSNKLIKHCKRMRRLFVI